MTKYIVYLVLTIIVYNIDIIIINKKRKKEGQEPIGITKISKEEWVLFFKILLFILLIMLPIWIVFIVVIFSK